MKVLVTGVSGQLGYAVSKALLEHKIATLGVDIVDFDIRNKTETERAIMQYRPTGIIHCAAYTAVDNAEEDRNKCYEINVTGTANVASVCKMIGAKMMYISSDYVFSGYGNSEPHQVEDETNPVNWYGETKLEGEKNIQIQLKEFFIVRSSWAFGKNGSNFVLKMLELGKQRDEISVVCDQIGSPTYTEDLAELLCDMIQTEKYGIYHATNEGFCSWADLAKEVFRLAGYSTAVKPVLSLEYQAKAKRPLNSRLSKEKLDEMGFHRLPLWQDGLYRYLHSIGII